MLPPAIGPRSVRLGGWPRTTTGAFLAWTIGALVLRAATAWVATPILARADAAGIAGDGTVYYLPLAESLREGRGFTGTGGPSASHMPGYPLLLVAARLFTPSFHSAILVVQIVFGALVVGLVFLLSASLGSRRVAHLSAAAALVWPDLVIYSLLNLSDTPCLAVTLAGACVLSRLLVFGSVRLALLLGLLVGAGILLRESMIAFAAPWMAALLFLPKGVAPPRRALHAGLVAAVACLVLVPWWVRNVRMFGEFIPLTTKGAQNLYAGTLRRPYYLTDARNQAVSMERALEGRERDVIVRAGRAPTLRERDAIFVAGALDNLRREPVPQLVHLVRKTYWLWQPNIGARHAGRLGMAPMLWLAAAAHWLLLGAGLSGFWALRRDRRARLVLTAPFAVVTALLAVLSIGEPRYHLALLPLLMVSAAPLLLGAIEALPRRVRVARTRSQARSA